MEELFLDMFPLKKSPLNSVHRPDFMSVWCTLGNSLHVSNSHLTFSSVVMKLNELLQLLQEKVIYFDTESIVYVSTKWHLVTSVSNKKQQNKLQNI